jgi:nucleoside-diphosphate-sugar epimerase
LKHGGYQIRGTLRNKSDPKKFNEVLKAFGKDQLSLIELVDMELNDYPSIERAVAGCKYVIHAACPNPSKAPKNDAPLIQAGSEGTTNVLKAAYAAKVKRVVVTCSIASIFMRTEANHKSDYDESDWSNPEMCLNIHHKITYNKELAVWKFINE